ncbi:MAG TPA: hypothetical protein PKX38_04275 [Alphaproteobacteria bacterium]|nr:hypothetical protein [Micavibrio sp.]MBK9561688.1 hypothetical protein [Micavibrio sp.]HQX27135.1 hypothetical protein [Alphaproteobacteria bacterium]
MKKLSELYIAVKSILGRNSPEEIAKQRAADFQEISEKFLEEMLRRYRGPAKATIDNINEVYIPLHNPGVLALETNLRNPNGPYVVVPIDFIQNAWNSATKLTRAIDALGFNLVSTVTRGDEYSLLMGVNPRNFSITETGKYAGPRQKIYQIAWGPKMPTDVVIVRAEHEWLSKPSEPSVPQSLPEPQPAAEMEATLQ